MTREADNVAGMIESVASALGGLTGALDRLGINDASTRMGALELLALEIKAGSGRVADALTEIAEAIRDAQGR